MKFNSFALASFALFSIALVGCGSNSKSPNSTSSPTPNVSSTPVNTSPGSSGGPILGFGNALWGMSPEQVSKDGESDLLGDVTSTLLGPYKLHCCYPESPSGELGTLSFAFFFENNRLIAVKCKRTFPNATQGIAEDMRAHLGEPTRVEDEAGARITSKWEGPDGSGAILKIVKAFQFESAEIFYYAPKASLDLIQSDDANHRISQTYNEWLFLKAKGIAQSKVAQGLDSKHAINQTLRDLKIRTGTPVAVRLMQEFEGQR